MRVPQEVDGKAAVALILDWVTAYQMLHRGSQVKAGQKIFVHALSGAVGGALLRVGQLQGAEVFAAQPHLQINTRSCAKLGTVPFDYSNKNWIATVQKLGGVDAVFDPLGFESFDESWSVLTKGGVLVGYGMNLPAWTKTPARPVIPAVLRLFSKNLLFWSGKRATFYGVRRASKNLILDLELLLGLLKSGKISVPIKATFKLDEIQKAHREYANSGRMGSIVIEVAP